MKKILELAERVCEKYTDSLTCELADAIKARRGLEQTPITEDWLKEHGWTNSYSVHKSVADYTNVTYQGYIKKGDHYLLDWCNGSLRITNDFNGAEFTKYDATLADLYDALELCNIKID